MLLKVSKGTYKCNNGTRYMYGNGIPRTATVIMRGLRLFKLSDILN